jgi:hypothetical protein
MKPYVISHFFASSKLPNRDAGPWQAAYFKKDPVLEYFGRNRGGTLSFIFK